MYFGPNFEVSTGGARQSQPRPRCGCSRRARAAASCSTTTSCCSTRTRWTATVEPVLLSRRRRRRSRSYTDSRRAALTVNAKLIPELAGHDFSTIVWSDGGHLAERAMYWRPVGTAARHAVGRRTRRRSARWDRAGGGSSPKAPRRPASRRSTWCSTRQHAAGRRGELLHRSATGTWSGASTSCRPVGRETIYREQRAGQHRRHRRRSSVRNRPVRRRALDLLGRGPRRRHEHDRRDAARRSAGRCRRASPAASSTPTCCSPTRSTAAVDDRPQPADRGLRPDDAAAGACARSCRPTAADAATCRTCCARSKSRRRPAARAPWPTSRSSTTVAGLPAGRRSSPSTPSTGSGTAATSGARGAAAFGYAAVSRWRAVRRCSTDRSRAPAVDRPRPAALAGRTGPTRRRGQRRAGAAGSDEAAAGADGQPPMPPSATRAPPAPRSNAATPRRRSSSSIPSSPRSPGIRWRPR